MPIKLKNRAFIKKIEKILKHKIIVELFKTNEKQKQNIDETKLIK